MNRLREMVSFELGKEIEKDVFCLVTSVGQRKRLNTHEESKLRPSDSALRCSTSEPQSVGARNPKVWGWIPHEDSEFFLCPTLVTRRKPHFSIWEWFVREQHELTKFFAGSWPSKEVRGLRIFFSNWFFLHIIKIVSFRKKSNVTKLPYQFLLFGTKTI